MDGERVVFTEESDTQRYIKLIASGDVDETLLDALTDYVKRQRKRLGLPPLPPLAFGESEAGFQTSVKSGPSPGPVRDAGMRSGLTVDTAALVSLVS